MSAVSDRSLVKQLSSCLVLSATRVHSRPSALTTMPVWPECCPLVTLTWSPTCHIAHLSSPFVHTMQQFFWQENMQSVVHSIQACLCIMLPATVAATVVDDSSNQP